MDTITTLTRKYLYKAYKGRSSCLVELQDWPSEPIWKRLGDNAEVLQWGAFEHLKLRGSQDARDAGESSCIVSLYDLKVSDRSNPEAKLIRVSKSYTLEELEAMANLKRAEMRAKEQEGK